jgi:catechol 2,3-dioxygenase-like lactoylglutathione lyase family enzyme
MKMHNRFLTILLPGLIITIITSYCSNPQKAVEESETPAVEKTEAPAVVDTSEFPTGTIQIGVIVQDLKKSVDFYTNVIGMTKTGGFSIDAAFGEKSGLTGGEPFDVTILKLKDSPEAAEWKLMSFGKEPTHPPQKYIQDDIGMQYITIFVKSMKPFLERLEKHNVTLLEETPTFIGDGRQFVFLQDPDGNFIELIGPSE